MHSIRYFGNFVQGFSRLRPDTQTYFDREGVEKPLGDKGSTVEGLVFRYMEMPAKEFVAVGVSDIVLRAPVLLIPERHTDGKGFFSDPHFGDNSAMRLLVDMIIANPEHRDAIGRILLTLGEKKKHMTSNTRSRKRLNT